VERFFPRAQIVFDRFHLMQMAGGHALDKLRKELAREGADLKGSLWALRGNEWTRSEEQCQQRSALRYRYPKLGRAIGLRDMLAQSIQKHWSAVVAFQNTGSPMAPSRQLTACSNLLSAWPKGSAPCVTSVSWPIAGSFISIWRPSTRLLLPTQNSEWPFSSLFSLWSFSV
jgi:hypothetical protein